MLRKILKYLSILLLVAAGFLSQVEVVRTPESMHFRPSSIRSLLDPIGGSLLSPLLAPRVPGTTGALKARAHIVNSLKNFGWDIDVREFIADAPHGPVPMANVLAHSSSSVVSQKPKLTIAAHYDSKLKPEGFIGAVDSAFPCALLLWLAERTQYKTPYTPFDIIFFDGEEAFQEWSDTDSLYGARHLAEQMNSDGNLPNTLVLLDLIGHDSRFPIPSWFPETERLHKELSNIDSKLVGGRPLHQYAGMMLDDHIPFLRLGVPVLHLIPPSFPEQWHTIDDNASILDWDTMEGWAVMLEKWLFDPPNKTEV